MLETSEPNWPDREVADIETDHFCSKHQIKSSYFKHETFLLPSLSFTLALAWKDNAVFCISQTTVKVGKLWNLEQLLFISA